MTLTGTPNFTSAYARADHGGVIMHAGGPAFSGAATGKRYQAGGNGVIVTSQPTTYFPGDVAGTTATGGQYY